MTKPRTQKPGDAHAAEDTAGAEVPTSGDADDAALSPGVFSPAETAAHARRVLDEVERVVVGKRGTLELVLLGVLAGGHVLIEDLPGLGKTVMARSFGQVLGLDFGRVQFTPDLLPSDVTGAPLFDQRSGDMVFRPGPIFTNLLLADEINRTPPKTQAALLEAMAEGQVSVDGTPRPLPDPFVVLATDNPIEYEGTYALPEAQLDRFLLRVRMGNLPPEGEVAMLRRRLDRGAATPVLERVVDAAGVRAMRASLELVEVSEDLLTYAVALVTATRQSNHVQVGASPRGALALVQLARGHAVLRDRDYVTPEDIKAVAVPALAHRVTLRPELWVRRISADDVIAEILGTVPTPRTVPVTQAAPSTLQRPGSAVPAGRAG
jgi:MoxR-like ATPase